MLKTRLLLTALLAAAVAVPASGAVTGSDANACLSGRSSLLVRVAGLKAASGTVKLATYGAEARRYLAKGGKLRKVVVPVRSKAPIDICIAVPGPGVYAVAVHHDLNGNGDKDGSDGGAYSNNPKLSLTNLRPAFRLTGVRVGQSPRRIAVTLQYRRGLSVGPAYS